MKIKQISKGGLKIFLDKLQPSDLCYSTVTIFTTLHKRK